MKKLTLALLMFCLTGCSAEALDAWKANEQYLPTRIREERQRQTARNDRPTIKEKIKGWVANW